MKTRLIACLAATVSLLTSPMAGAQDVAAGQSGSFGVMAGGEFMTGAFRGAFKPGIELGVIMQSPRFLRQFALRGDVMYHLIGEHNSVCIETGCTDQNTYSHLVSGSVDIVAHLTDPAKRWSPYVLVGAAVYGIGNADESIVGFTPDHFGFQGGIGFEFRSGKTPVLVEMRYMAVHPGGVVPVTVGFRF
jgi:hypothetical protein